VAFAVAFAFEFTDDTASALLFGDLAASAVESLGSSFNVFTSGSLIARGVLGRLSTKRTLMFPKAEEITARGATEGIGSRIALLSRINHAISTSCTIVGIRDGGEVRRINIRGKRRP